MLLLLPSFPPFVVPYKQKPCSSVTGRVHSSNSSSVAGFHYRNRFYSKTGKTVNHKGAFSARSSWHDLATAALKKSQLFSKLLSNGYCILFSFEYDCHHDYIRVSQTCTVGKNVLFSSIQWTTCCVYIAAKSGQRKDILYLAEVNC